MFNEISYYPDPVFGKPLILWGGVCTLLCLIITAAIGHMTVKGIKNFPMEWHTRLAILTLLLAIGHGLMGILAYF